MNIPYKKADFLHIVKHPAMGIDFWNWMKLLARNGFRVHPGFIPKVLFLTANTLLNLPVQLYEHLRYTRKIKRQQIKAPIFILGHPRSGTTYLHYVLSKDPRVAYCSTYEALVPNIFLTGGRLMKNMLAAAMPERRPQDEMKITIDSPMEEEFAMGNLCQASFMHGFYFPKRIMENFDRSVVFEDRRHALHWKRHFHYFLKKLACKHPGKTLLLKSPANTGRLKEIFELFPDARFIHIHRHPYEVYLSNERLYERILPLTGFQRVRNEAIVAYILESYSKMYRKFLKDKKEIPAGQLFEIRYEDFVRTPMEQLEKAYRHLGISGFQKSMPYFEKEVKSARDYQPNAYAGLSEELKARIKEKWRFAFEEWGYEG